MISREITKEIRQLGKEFPIVTILGPRQSGKTTLAKHIFKKYKYISFEDLDIRHIANEDPRGFLKQYNKNVIIDEVQRVPDFFSYLQTHVDEIKTKGSFILTGSNNYLLMNNISQSLAGRVGIANLFPLTIKELLSVQNLELNDMQFSGFYPRIFDQNIRPISFYRTYLSTYLEKDIRMMRNIVNFNNFNNFLRLLAGRVGEVLNINSLAQDAGIEHKTASEWLNILETSYIIFRLRPFYKNYNKRITKHPKIYFYDVGLVSYLLGIRKSSELDNHYFRGNIFENFIVSDFIKSDFNQGGFSNFYFWQDNHRNEVDLIIEKSNKIKAIEIKAGQTIRGSMFRNIYYWQNLNKELSSDSYVVYAGDRNLEKNGIKIINWQSIKNIIK